MGALSALPNIGAVLEAQLQQAGIETPQQLASAGSEQAWLRIQSFDPSACLHRLTALEGAIQGVKKSALPASRKAELKTFYQLHKLPAKPAGGL